MALVNCKECGGPVSTDAKACPKCGAKPPKRTSVVTWIFVGLIVVTIGLSVVKSNQAQGEREAAEAAKTPEQKAAEVRKEREFQIVLAGANRLKSSMKKPETFELLFAGMIDGKVVCYEYKARNSWNDVRKEYYVITDTVSSNKPEAWNRHCAGKTMTDYTYARAVLQ